MHSLIYPRRARMNVRSSSVLLRRRWISNSSYLHNRISNASPNSTALCRLHDARGRREARHRRWQAESRRGGGVPRPAPPLPRDAETTGRRYHRPSVSRRITFCSHHSLRYRYVIMQQQRSRSSSSSSARGRLLFSLCDAMTHAGIGHCRPQLHSNTDVWFNSLEFSPLFSILQMQLRFLKKTVRIVIRSFLAYPFNSCKS